jgi:hypothetical protein
MELEKAGGSHDLLMEMHEEPKALTDTLKAFARVCKKIAFELTEDGS